jgi:hypothetical protein
MLRRMQVHQPLLRWQPVGLYRSKAPGIMRGLFYGEFEALLRLVVRLGLLARG